MRAFADPLKNDEGELNVLYLLRRRWMLMVVIALLIAALVLMILLLMPKSQTYADAWYV